MQPGTDSLTVQWSAPDYEGSSDVTGYDVRHIPSNSASKRNDSAWPLIEDAATATPRRHTIAGLTDGRRRDVQVRAVNGGGGDWSVTARGTPGVANIEPFFVAVPGAVFPVDETAAAGESAGEPLSARDYEGDALSYMLGGIDVRIFGIDSSTGQLLVEEPLDYETAPVHVVSVTVSDMKADDGSADNAVDASIDVAVVVTDVDEAPTVAGDTSVSHMENDGGRVATYTATDPEGAALAWFITGTCCDRVRFEMNNGQLEFFRAPDYENPTDQNRDNVYNIVVGVNDGVNDASLGVTVTVTDINEPFTLDHPRRDGQFPHPRHQVPGVRPEPAGPPLNGSAPAWHQRHVAVGVCGRSAVAA